MGLSSANESTPNHQRVAAGRKGSTGSNGVAAGGPRGQAAADKPVWPEALAAHRRWLRAVVFARVGDAHAVEEVLQEVALAAVRQSSLPTEGPQLGAWLYRVAVRQALLHRRRAGREQQKRKRFAQQVSSQATPDGDSCGDPLQWLLADEDTQWVRQALGALSRGDRELLLLKYGENWTGPQIAAHLGVRPNTVQIRLHRARKRLRTELTRLSSREEHR